MLNLGSEEITQWLRVLPYKNEDLSSEPWHSYKSLSITSTLMRVGIVTETEYWACRPATEQWYVPDPVRTCLQIIR